MSILESLGHWVISLISKTGYLGVFIAMAIGACLIPIPSEVTMPFAGALAATGELNLWIVSLIGALGNLVGSWGAYLIGMKLPEPALLKFLEKWGKFILLTPHEYHKAKIWLKKYGSSVSFFSRLIPGVRAVISLPCGVSRINFTKFSIWTFIGSFIWSFLLAYIGYMLGENWESIKDYFHKFDTIIVALILLAFGVYVYMHFKKREPVGE